MDQKFYEISDEHQNTIRQYFPEEGEVWLEQFPVLLDQIVDRWQLDLAEVLEGGFGVNRVYGGTKKFEDEKESQQVVLKIGIPNKEGNTEIEALRAWGGRQSVKLIADSKIEGALLLERLTPGSMLKNFSDNKKETEIAAGIMSALPGPALESSLFPHFDQWIEGALAEFRQFSAESSPEFSVWTELAESYYQEISSSDEEDLLLHGDLHHENILYDQTKGWLAIDPKGVMGKPLFEVGRFIQNFFRAEGKSGIKNEIEERISIISEVLHRPSSDILKAAMVDLVMSFCWALNSWNKSRLPGVTSNTDASDKIAITIAESTIERIEIAEIYQELL